MTETVVAEGQVKFRDGKKWKTRFVVLQKPSPVADCLSLLVYKEKKRGKEKGSGHKERLTVTLEGICGVEPGAGYDGVSYTLSILCLAHTLVLGFSRREALLAWDARVCYSLGEVHRFSVDVEPGTKLESGSASLHLCNGLLVLAKGRPPVVAGHWRLSALRRYGAVPNGFVFEGGTRCGAWAGVFFLSCSEGEQISLLFDCIVRGIAPRRAQRDLRPSLPDPNSDPALTEERISQEASELEKRLSVLSLASSAASTYSCSTVAGDDRSSISSSSSGHSDTSFTARLPLWVDPLARSRISCDMASSSSTLKPLTCSDDQLDAAGGSETRPSSAHIHTRGLHDSGRQSSLDSGIGIATGSQSSTGSLDMTSQGGGEELISIAGLSTPTPSLPHSVPPPPALPFQPEPSSATSFATSYASKASACSSRRHSDEYQIPNLLRLWYNTPKSLLPPPKAQDGKPEHGRSSRCNGGGGRSQEQGVSSSLTGLRAQHQAMMQRSLSWDSESDQRSTPRPGQTQSRHDLDNYITPEQLQLVKNRAPSEAALGTSDARDDGGAVGSKLWALKRLLSSRPPSAPPPPPALLRPTSACASLGGFQLPMSTSLDSRLHSGGSVHYVNVPIGSLLAEAPSVAPGLGVHTAVREEASIRYAHLNIAAMETAPRVGAEHVQGREDRLTQLESKRRGPPR